jgi:hypothetical protein
MRAVFVVVDDVVDQHVLQMTATKDQHPVQTLSTHRANEALGECVGSWSPDWGADDADTFGPEDLVEARGELGVSVPD